MQFQQLIDQISSCYALEPEKKEGHAEITSICADSKEVEKGALFVCMPSKNTRTHDLLPEVKTKGTAACMVHSEEGYKKACELHIPVIYVPESDHQFLSYLGHFCSLFYQNLTSKMKVIGITGTKGKTTTSWILSQALETLGVRSAYIGSLGYHISNSSEHLANTTPFPVELWKFLNQADEEGIECIVMEASSHGLLEKRLAGVRFDMGVFTNLTQDHLDYHPSMEEYANAKKLLFTEYAHASKKPFISVLNADDLTAKKWMDDWDTLETLKDGRFLTFGLEEGDLRASYRDVDLHSLTLELIYQGQKQICKVPLGGIFNVSNSLCAAACLIGLGYSLPKVASAMEQVKPAPGRFEPVPNDQQIQIIVDHAHAPDALEKVLIAARKLDPKRVITVFGCGGDRDRTKRPKMAEIATRLSDLTIITSDNPRTENPEQIIEEIKLGIVNGADYLVEVDRKKAVELAIQRASQNDLVLIAGKGNEDYQIIGRTKIFMDDRVLAREALKLKQSHFSVAKT